MDVFLGISFVVDFTLNPKGTRFETPRRCAAMREGPPGGRSGPAPGRVDGLLLDLGVNAPVVGDSLPKKEKGWTCPRIAVLYQ